MNLWSIKIKPVNILLYSASALIAVFTIGLMVALLSPVDVLKNWQINVPNPVYHAGNVIFLDSSYVKVRKISGNANRYLQCKKPDGKWDGFILLSTANANRPQASTANAVTALAIPPNVANLPSTCRIYINVDYEVNSFRNFTEQTYSNEFKLLPKEGEVSPNQPTSTLPTSQAPTGTVVSSTDSDGNKTRFSQPDITQSSSVTVSNPAQSPTSTQPPTLLQTVTNALMGTFNAVRGIIR